MSIFSKVPSGKRRTSAFNLGHEVKLTTDFFKLTPFLAVDVIPGDSFRDNTEIMLRMAPMFAPIMHRVNVYTHFFFVPYRLLWDNWEDFITQSVSGRAFNSAGDPLADVPKVIPRLRLARGNDPTTDYPYWRQYVGSGSLADYLGLQTRVAGLGSEAPDAVPNFLSFTINPLWFLAYQRIYNDYYRDENLENPVYDHLDFTDMSVVRFNKTLYGDVNPITDEEYQSIFKLRYRPWAKDYFAGALPFVQKGEDVTLPIGGTAPVTTNTAQAYNVRYADNLLNGSVFPVVSKGNGTQEGQYSQYGHIYANMAAGDLSPAPSDLSEMSVTIPPLSGSADLSSATAVTINELRRANALQRWFELNARGGTRYVEQLAAHFHVRPKDSRLQRAEYLGGGKAPVTISEVLQTSQSTESGTSQGNMAGHGLSASMYHAFTRRHFDEHGVVLGILSVVPKANYMQGANRFFGKRHFDDFAWPAFANLGEQEVYSWELFNDGIPADSDSYKGFGYVPRYAEFKTMPDRICGEFRTSMDNWHLGRLFAGEPVLNNDFISGKNFKSRIFALNDNEPVDSPLWIQIYNDLKAIRPLPYYGTPSL